MTFKETNIFFVAFHDNSTLEPEAETTRTHTFTSSPLRSDHQWPIEFCPQHTCQNHCGSTFEDCEKQECSCDNRCVIFNDCCPDYVEACSDKVTLLDESELDKHSQMLLYMTKDYFDVGTTIYWVSRCPLGSVVDLREKCESHSKSTFLQYIPVFVNGYVFRNMYCALCHNVSPGNESFGTAVTCFGRFEGAIQEAIAFNNVDKVFHLVKESETDESACAISYPPHMFPYMARRFVQFWERPEESCPLGMRNTTNEIKANAMTCENYQSPISFHHNSSIVTYKNPHCALCDARKINIIENDGYTCLPNKCPSSRTNHVNVPFSLLVDFNPVKGEDFSNFRMSSAFCHSGHIYDSLNMKCHLVDCPVGSVFNGSSCFQYYRPSHQVFEDNSQELVTVVYSGFTNQDTLYKIVITVTNYLKSIDDVFSIHNSYMCGELPLKGMDIVSKSQTVSEKTSKEEHMCFVFVFKPSRAVQYLLRELLFQMLIPIRDFNVESMTILFYTFDISQSLDCGMGKEFETDNVILDESKTFPKVYSPNTGYYGSFSHVPVMISFDAQRGYAEYITSALICVVDQEPVLVDSLKVLTTMAMVTIIGNSISIFALILTFVSLCFFSSLKGTFRILLINLTLSLFISQIGFMFQDIFIDNHKVCQCIAIFQHYAWLSYFFLMNAIAFEVALKFRSFSSLIETRYKLVHKRKLSCLLIYGWLSPLTLVISSVVLNYEGSSSFNPQYGKGSACWINNPTALLAFFVIPFSCIVCLNTCLLIFAIIRIKQISMVGNVLSQEHNHFHINIKLSMLMGVSWMIGLVASYTQIDAVWYVFIVLNTLQGAVLFFSFGLPTKKSCQGRRTSSRRNTSTRSVAVVKLYPKCDS